MEWTRKLAVLFMLLVVTALLTVGALAAEKTVYLSAEGGGTGLTPDSPVSTIAAAFHLLDADGGTVAFLGEWTTPTYRMPALPGNVTFAAGDEGGKLVMTGDLGVMPGDGVKTLTFDLPIEVRKENVSGEYNSFFGSYNSITFGPNCSMHGDPFEFYGGYSSGSSTATNCISKLPYTVTVYAGTFVGFHGGNQRQSVGSKIGAIASPITINIYGGTFGLENGEYPVGSNNTDYSAFDISGMSFLCDDAELNISGGTFYCPIYAQGRTRAILATVSLDNGIMNNRDYYAIDGDIDIHISGGNFLGGLISARHTQAVYNTLVRGNFTLNITGGTFADGTVLDATQVKAYEGRSEIAALRYDADAYDFDIVRFDMVNGEAKTYEEPIRVAFIGDSITEGHEGMDDGKTNDLSQTQFRSYPAQFLKKCEEAGLEVLVGNFGVSSSGVSRFSKYYYGSQTSKTNLAFPLASEECDPTYVFVALGTNDYAAGSSNGMQLDFENEYRALLEWFGDLPSVETVFVSNAIHRNGDSVNSVGVASVIRPLQERITNELAAKQKGKFQFVDLFGLTWDAATTVEGFFSGDNLHPRMLGYGIMADAVYGAIFEGKYAPEEEYRRTDIWISGNGSPNGAGTPEDPISRFSVAMSKMMPGEEVTLHVKGKFAFRGTTDHSLGLQLSLAPSELHIVGDGDDAVFSLGTAAAHLFCGTDTDIRDLRFLSERTAPSGHIFAEYHNINIADTVTFGDGWSFYAGFAGYYTDVATHFLDTKESLSSARDCTIVIDCNASFEQLMLGNRRMDATAPFGTYSGKMVAQIGENVSIGTSGYHGVVGHNYLTGRVIVRNLTGEMLPEYSAIGSMSGLTYDASENTGTIYQTAQPVGNGDTNGDGEITVEDALIALRAMLEGKLNFAADLDGDGRISLLDVLRVLKLAVN